MKHKRFLSSKNTRLKERERERKRGMSCFRKWKDWHKLRESKLISQRTVNCRWLSVPVHLHRNYEFFRSPPSITVTLLNLSLVLYDSTTGICHQKWVISLWDLLPFVSDFCLIRGTRQFVDCVLHDNHVTHFWYIFCYRGSSSLSDRTLLFLMWLK